MEIASLIIKTAGLIVSGLAVYVSYQGLKRK